MSLVALGFALGLGLVLVGLGWRIVVPLDSAGVLSDFERALCAFLIGTLVLYFAVMAVGHWRFDRVSMGGIGLVLVALALPGWRAMPWRRMGLSLRRLFLAAGEDWRLAGLLGLLALTLVVSYVQGLAPPNDYDSLMYHLALPRFNLEQGNLDPPFGHRLPNVLFPHLVTNISRFALALMGEGATQPSVGLFGIAACAGTALLARRMAMSAAISLAAALIFLTTRVVIWEIGTVEVDLPLAAMATAALIVFLAWRGRPHTGLIVLFGLLLGSGFAIKYQGGLVGFAFAPALIWAWFAYPRQRWALCLAPLISVLTFVPHMAEDYRWTGNPVFPLYNALFVKDSPPFYTDYNLTYGTGRGWLDLLTEPWSLSVAPMQHFDGMILGAPILLALAPLALLGMSAIRHRGIVLTWIGAYYVLWFFVQSQQVRFLLPILPALAVFAAFGARRLALVGQPSQTMRGAFLVLLGLLAANQALFVGVYAALRLPPALGLMSPEAYHERTPTLTGANYRTCRFISDHLLAGQRYLSFLGPHSYYCPQAAAIMSLFEDENRTWLTTRPAPKISFENFIARLEQAKIRFVIVPTGGENRRNETGVPVPVAVNFDEHRFGPFVAPILTDLTPIATERFSAVYDGSQILERLRSWRDSGRNLPEPR
ncbi:MAG: glycosyltransferase family 39 protein [Rhodospirillales bacterium]|nr:glycosyltransferase family 39 protein [Rhodospirillales bacterium]